MSRLINAKAKYCSNCGQAANWKISDAPTQRQEEYAKYLAKRMCIDLPKEYTKIAYSDFISRWKPVVKAEDDAMNEPNAWQWQYL